MRKLCYVATSSASVHTFLRGMSRAAAERFDVTVICAADDPGLLAGIQVRMLFLPITRNPSPIRDLCVLFRLLLIFKREKFDIVHSIMPKSGFLSMVVARMIGVPVRIHTFSGQVWVTRKGWFRKLLIGVDRMIGRCATLSLVDGECQRQFLLLHDVFNPHTSRIVGSGSICGVDTARFRPDAAARAKVRQELGVTDSDVVILFAGRLNKDKGIFDLVAAFCALSAKFVGIHLLLVASEEDVKVSDLAGACQGLEQNFHHISFTLAPETYMAASDIYCLPSYREGMPMSVLESAACAVPAIVSNIYGNMNAIDPDHTGLFFRVGDVQSLVEALSKLVEDADFRRRLGMNAKMRIEASFACDKFHEDLFAIYGALLAA